MHRYHWHRKIRRRKVSGNIIHKKRIIDKLRSVSLLNFYRLGYTICHKVDLLFSFALTLSMDLPIFIGKISPIPVAKVLDLNGNLDFS